MKQENQRPPLTVEDLLRLKRAERPNPDFWVRFDQELRTKQLAALVKREPWWNRLAEVWTFNARYRLAVGATAILALSFVTARQYQVVRAPVAPVAAPQVAAAKSSVVVNIVPIAPNTSEAAVLPAFTVATTEEAEPISIQAVEEPKPVENRSHLISLLPGPNTSELIAASLAATEAAAPSVTRGMFGLSTGFESRALPTRASAAEPREPLADMRHPTDVKRIARVEAMMAMATQMDVSSRLGVPVTSRVSFDERMYEEQPGRLKVGGDKASFNTTLKF